MDAATMVCLTIALLASSASAPLGLADSNSRELSEAAWTEVTPLVSPPAMAGANAAYSDVHNRFVLFGGWNGVELGETWIFDPTNQTWEKAATQESPPARGDAAFAYDSREDVFVLFGGWYDSPPETYHRFGDTWHFSLRNATWTQVFPSTSPSPRSDSAIAYDSRDVGFVLFGGFDGSRYLGETWRYDAREATWTNMTPSLEPSPRADGRMAYDSWHNRLLIFGGNDFSGPGFTFHHLEDTWIYFWTNNTWMELQMPNHPSARDYAVFDFHNSSGRFLLHGGYGDRVILGDLWAFDVTRNAWEEIVAVGPEPRFAAIGGYAWQDSHFLIFGGLGDSGLLNDTWLLRFATANRPSSPSLLDTVLIITTATGLSATFAIVVLLGKIRKRRGGTSRPESDIHDIRDGEERRGPASSKGPHEHSR